MEYGPASITRLGNLVTLAWYQDLGRLCQERMDFETAGNTGQRDAAAVSGVKPGFRLSTKPETAKGRICPVTQLAIGLGHA